MQDVLHQNSNVPLAFLIKNSCKKLLKPFSWNINKL